MAKGIKRVVRNGKVYEYDASRYKKKHISKEARKKLVGKNGRIIKKNVEAYKEQINSSSMLTRSEKTTLINQVDAYVKNAHKNKDELTVMTLESKAAKDQRQKMVMNTGYDYADFLKEYGFEAQDWETDENWNNDVYTDPISGKQYKYVHNYYNSIIEEI